MKPAAATGRTWVLLGVILVSMAILLRMLLNFRHTLPPSTDGAYYPMQTWWLIEHGRLMYDDLPLMFWLNAGLALLIQMITHWPLDEAAILASRLIDCIAQPMAAIFILMLGYGWSAGRREAMLGCGAAAVLAVFSPPILRMASDFQKNSLGLVWMVFALWAMHRALARPRRIERWGLLAAVVLLCGLTHIGAFGVTCIMLLAAGGVYLISSRKADGRAIISRRNLTWLLATLSLAGVMLLIVWLFDPVRTVSLLTAPWRLVSVNHLRPSPSILLALVVYLMLGFYTRWLWANHRTMARPDQAVLVGTIVAVGVLVFPFFPSDYVQRFMLMTPVPAGVLMAFLMAHHVTTGKPRWQTKAVAGGVLLLAMVSPLMMQGPSITLDEADEIKSLADLIPDPTHTLIVAAHGQQYWAGLLLHTPVRMGEVPDDAFGRYGSVLMLQQTGSSRRPPPQRDRRRPGPPEPPGLRTIAIPPDAILLRQTSHFKLYRINPPSRDYLSGE